MKVLSLFDGMSCGMIAFKEIGIVPDKYVAYEIDKYAIQTSKHNFPEIEHCGDVFDADFTKYAGFDWLIGGSPCTHWSIAQTKNRETTASGVGWELFSQYVRALREAKPKYFLYENNKSMSKAIKESISETFGFEPILINSALVSAQNRQRLYWCGIRQEDGTYRKANVEQPEDKGILLKDILETSSTTWLDKSHAIDANYFKGGNTTSPKKQSGQRNMVAEPIATTKDGKSFTVTATEYKGSNPKHTMEKHVRTMVAEPVNITEDGKSQTLKAQYHKNSVANFCGYTSTYGATGVAEPVKYCTEKNVEHLMRDFGSKGKIVSGCDKTPTLMAAAGCGGGNGIYYGEPVRPMNYELESVTDKDSGVVAVLDMKAQDNIKRVYGENGKAPTLTTCGGGHREPKVFTELPECFRVKEATKTGYTEIEAGDCVDMSMPNSKTRRGRNMKDKSNCLQTSCAFFQYCGTVKTPIYEVKDGQITIKGKQYPIKLVDGYYIIRKLTVRECMRLQTVPEWFEFPVSNSQSYKQLGNGWTCSVICHLVDSILKDDKE